MLFEKKIKFLKERELGEILRKYLEEEFSSNDFINPINSNVGGTPQYTYLNLLDKWYVMKRSPKFRDLTNDIQRLEFVCRSRGYYTDDEINEIIQKPVENHREALLRLIDYEFGVKFAKLNDGGYEDVRDEVVAMIEPLDADYLKLRGEDKI